MHCAQLTAGQALRRAQEWEIALPPYVNKDESCFEIRLMDHLAARDSLGQVGAMASKRTAGAKESV